jgi:hypothetical protein
MKIQDNEILSSMYDLLRGIVFCLLVPCLPSASSLCMCVCVCLCVYRASIQAYVQVMIRELLHYSVAKLSKVCLVRLQSRQETKSDEYVV